MEYQYYSTDSIGKSFFKDYISDEGLNINNMTITTIIDYLKSRNISNILILNHKDENYTQEYSKIYKNYFISYPIPSKCKLILFFDDNNKFLSYISFRPKDPLIHYSIASSFFTILQENINYSYKKYVITCGKINPLEYLRSNISKIDNIIKKEKIDKNQLEKVYNGFYFYQPSWEMDSCLIGALKILLDNFSSRFLTEKINETMIELTEKIIEQPGNNIMTLSPSGFFTQNILNILKGYNLDYNYFAKSNEKNEDKKIINFIYYYIESQIPVLISTKNHSYVIIGHDLFLKRKFKINEDYQFSDPSLFIENFIILDPATGIFILKSIDDLLNEICEIIIPLPKEVNAFGEHVHQISQGFFMKEYNYITLNNNIKYISYFENYIQKFIKEGLFRIVNSDGIVDKIKKIKE
ncbi:MAG: hypothetical protein ACTSQO_03885 [Candidatus Helarchaeota archaeon]